MSVRRELEATVLRHDSPTAMGPEVAAEIHAKAIAALAAIEAFSTDEQSVGSALLALDEIEDKLANAPRAQRGVVAVRAEAGQMAARAAHRHNSNGRNG
jgi:hypothetical protein